MIECDFLCDTNDDYDGTDDGDDSYDDDDH